VEKDGGFASPAEGGRQDERIDMRDARMHRDDEGVKRGGDVSLSLEILRIAH